MNPIAAFSGEYAFLSNFYAAPVTLQGLTFPTVEHAFQAAKTPDLAWARRIREAPTPGAAKRLGQQCPLRQDWDEVKDDVMLALVRLKFIENPPLAQRLLGTGTRMLIEGNTWGDMYWGMVPASEPQGSVDPQSVSRWVGENRLGMLLMRVRAEVLWALEPEHAEVVGDAR